MKILRSAAQSQNFFKIPKPANFLDNFAPLILSKLFSTVVFWCLKVSLKNRTFPGFSGKKVPENFFPGRKFRETSREVDLGQDRPTQRVSAKSVDPNATPMVYFLVQTLLIFSFRQSLRSGSPRRSQPPAVAHAVQRGSVLLLLKMFPNNLLTL